jgi:hypothetical protein
VRHRSVTAWRGCVYTGHGREAPTNNCDARILDKHVIVLRRERAIDVAWLDMALKFTLYLAFVVADVNGILEFDHIAVPHARIHLA